MVSEYDWCKKLGAREELLFATIMQLPMFSNYYYVRVSASSFPARWHWMWVGAGPADSQKYW